MAEGWYYSSRTTGSQVGPFTWEQLYALARGGSLGADDLVWNPELPEWVPASRIPGLLDQPLSAGARPMASAAAPAASQPNPARPAAHHARRRSTLLAWLLPLIALIIVGAGFGAYFGFFYHRGNATGEVAVTTTSLAAGGSTTSTAGQTTTTAGETTTTTGSPDIGVAQTKLPDSAKLIQTAAWGEVPANQIGGMLAEGKSRSDADVLAQALGGSVVGEVSFANTYLIETSGSTEADLKATLDKAVAMDGVRLAFPNAESDDYTEIWGVRQDALSDPVYGEGRGKGLKMIGTDKAWRYIKASGLDLNDVNVGVIDSGLYTGSSEFGGDTKINYPDGQAGPLTSPETLTAQDNSKVNKPAGSHGTMVAGIIGADPKNGGMAGIASTALGGKLTLSVIRNNTGQYGGPIEVKNPPPNGDITQVRYSTGRTYAIGDMVAIMKEIQAGARVINCSWGAEDGGQNNLTAAIYKIFFQEMAQRYPDVLFVCAAGNDGSEQTDGAKAWPAGLKLPNMITVGNVTNDNKLVSSSNQQNTTKGHEFEVPLAAPGDQVVQGVDSSGQAITDETPVVDGRSLHGGTSAAAPMVTSAAALLLSLDPSLDAAALKDILVRNAQTGPAQLGGKTLDIAAAVLEVINNVRKNRGLDQLTAEELDKGAIVDAVATGDPASGVWKVSAGVLVPTSPDGAEVTISATNGVDVSGSASVQVTTPVSVEWNTVTVPKDQTVKITVTRKDTGASSVITLPPDITSWWKGTFTITKIDFSTMEAETSAEFMGCDPNSVDWKSFVQWLSGTPLPAMMLVDMTDSTTGRATIKVDPSPLKGKAPAGVDVNSLTSNPVLFNVTYRDCTITLEVKSGQDVASASMTAPVNRPLTGTTFKGHMSTDNEGTLVEADFEFTREE